MEKENWSLHKKRVMKAIHLEVPDCVPIFTKQSYLPCSMYGLTYETAYYDQDAWLAVNRRFIQELAPDMFFATDSPVCGPGMVHQLLGNRQMRWPGHGIDENTTHQFLDNEYLKSEDYDAFIDDPSDFLIRRFVPQLYENLEGLAELPSLKTTVAGSYTASFFTSCFASPALQKALKILMEAASYGKLWSDRFDAFHAEMEAGGFVSAYTPPVCVTPFDAMASYLRGLMGVMVDMSEEPERLLAAKAKLMPQFLNTALFAGKRALQQNPEESPRIYIPLHLGGDMFMSPAQFETFYWPDLRHMLTSLIDAGITPMPFFEGCWDTRLDYLAELPRGKVVGVFDSTNLALAKEKLGNRICLVGGMPSTELQFGSPQSVCARTKELCETLGRDGGYIMCTNTVLDGCQPQLVQAWIDATREFGRY